ncbi:MAG: hypothetical protein D6731_15510 [Planctomycetota bacterium]|nr:MAG: hypothetical protein D6731_15510 [Planctomycetota bacterium]
MTSGASAGNTRRPPGLPLAACFALVLLPARAQAQPKDLTNVVAVRSAAQPLVLAGASNQEFLRVEFTVTGSTGTMNLDALTLTSLNTADADVAAVRLWFNTVNDFATASEITPPGGPHVFTAATLTLTLATPQDLPAGTSYLWVAFDLAAGAGDGNQVGCGLAVGALSIPDDGTEAWPKVPYGAVGNDAGVREVVRANYFVNDTTTTNDQLCTAPGNNANAGTSPDQPKASLEGASGLLNSIGSFAPGDVIWIEAGDYELSARIDLTSAHSGTAGNLVVFRGAGRDASGTYRSRLTDAAGGATRQIFYFDPTAHHIELRDLEIYGARQQGGQDGDGVYADRATDLVFRGCFVHDNAQNGIRVTNDTDATVFLGAHLVTGCTVTNNAAQGVLIKLMRQCVVEDSELAANTADGVQVVTDSTGTIVRRCRIHGNGGYGVSIGDNTVNGGNPSSTSTSPSIVEDCVIYDHTTTNRAGVGLAGMTGAGAGFGIVRRNVLYQNFIGVIVGGVFTANPHNDATVENNTIYSTITGTNASGLRFSRNSQNFLCRNNVVAVSDGGTTNPIFALVLANGSGTAAGNLDFNDYYLFGGGSGENLVDDNGTVYADLTAPPTPWKSNPTGYDQNTISADPLFRDVDGPDNLLGGANGADDDFHLDSQGGAYDPRFGVFVLGAATSPCIDAGTGGAGAEGQPNGGVINQGAYGGTSFASRTFSAPLAPSLAANAPEPEGLSGSLVPRVGGAERIAVDWTFPASTPVSNFKLSLWVRDSGGGEHRLLADASDGGAGQNGAGPLRILEVGGSGQVRYQAVVTWDPPDDFPVGACDLKVVVTHDDGAAGPLSSVADYTDGDNASELLVTSGPRLLTADGAHFPDTQPTLAFEGFEAGPTFEFVVEVANDAAFSSLVETADTTLDPPGFTPAATQSPYASRLPVTYQVQTALAAGTYYWRVRSGGQSSEVRSFTVDAGATPTSPFTWWLQGRTDQFRADSLEGCEVAGGVVSLTGAPAAPNAIGTLLTRLVNVSALRLGRPAARMTQWQSFTVTGTNSGTSQVSVELWRHTRDNSAPDAPVAGTLQTSSAATFSLTITPTAESDAFVHYLRITLTADGAGNEPTVTAISARGDEAATTAVTLANLRASAHDGEVLVEWETGAELSNLGFNVYRSREPDRDYALVSDPAGLIVGLGSDVGGGRYYFRDQSVRNGTTYYYLVEDVESGGRVSLHGPVAATPAAGLGSATPTGPYVNGQTNDGSASWPSGEAARPDASRTPGALAAWGSVEITGADAHGFDIAIDVPRFAREALVAGTPSQPYDRLVLPGYEDSQSLGRPLVPTRTVWVEVPEVAGAALEDLHATAESASGYALAAVLGQNPPRYGPLPPTHDGSRPWPPAALEVETVLRQGERTLLGLRVWPIAYTANAGDLHYRRRIEARVRYLAPSPPAPPTWRETTQDALLQTPGVLKIVVAADGVYRLSGADLAAAGFDLSGDPRRLTLYHRGAPLPLRVLGEADGRFEPSDALEFYGQRNTDTYPDSPQTRFSDENAYWLAYAGTPGPRVPEIDATPSGSAPFAPSFRDRVRHEEQRLVRRFPFPEPGRDRWFSDELIGAPGPTPSVTYLLRSFAPARPEAATLRYRLRGSSEGLAADPDHRVEVLFNGVLVDALAFDGRIEVTREVAVSGVAFGDNDVTLRVLGDSSDRVLVDWAELEFARRFASADRATLSCRLPGGGGVRLTNFAAADPVCWDVSDPAAPRLLRGAVRDEGSVLAPDGTLSAGPSYALELDLQAAGRGAPGDVALLALTSAGTASPLRLELGDGRGSLRRADGADYVVLTHASLRPAAERLAAYRQGQGLRSRVVTVDEVMDTFAYGNLDPEAIAAFVRHAYERWAPPRPKYLCVLGDGHYDTHDYLGEGAANLVPPILRETEQSWAACDNRYATVAGDDAVPDLLVGRLPARTLPEANALIDKLLAYEALAFDASWGARSVFVADDTDAADFAALNEGLIARLPAGHTAVRLRLGVEGDAATLRGRIATELNAPGALLLVYAGHGDTTRWADEDLWNSHRWLPGGALESDLDRLSNAGRPCVVTALNCLTGEFAFASQSLNTQGEAWLRRASGGAVAVCASTGLTRPDPQERLGRHLFEVLWAERVGVLGDALGEAKLRLAQEPGGEDVLDTFGLLGDPATSLYAEERRFASPRPFAPARERAGLPARLFGCGLAPRPAPPTPLALFALLLCGLCAARRRARYPSAVS